MLAKTVNLAFVRCNTVVFDKNIDIYMLLLLLYVGAMFSL